MDPTVKLGPVSLRSCQVISIPTLLSSPLVHCRSNRRRWQRSRASRQDRSSTAVAIPPLRFESYPIFCFTFSIVVVVSG
ncbi:hypothetical protein L6164_009681 [Bauhinia variegata]|uniref:Uncharacterized protein n=1 Tax=Bauhinia variegata TaxID=167791 RepID=A0ACB9PKG4_BAUVA|nr:hypothetical protein L6164_009681 [Bauhinia variegata]